MENRFLAVPPLGCGHGQLEWRVVGPTLYRRLSRLDIPVELYAPHGTPAEQMDEAFLAGADEKPLAFGQSLNGSRVSPAAVALVSILSRISARPTIGRSAGRASRRSPISRPKAASRRACIISAAAMVPSRRTSRSSCRAS